MQESISIHRGLLLCNPARCGSRGQYHHAVAGGSLLLFTQTAPRQGPTRYPRGGTDLMTRVKCDCEQGPTRGDKGLHIYISDNGHGLFKPQCFAVLHQQSIKLKVVLLPSD